MASPHFMDFNDKAFVQVVNFPFQEQAILMSYGRFIFPTQN